MQPKIWIIIEKEKAQLLLTIKNALFYSKVKRLTFRPCLWWHTSCVCPVKGWPRLTLVLEGWREWKIIIKYHTTAAHSYSNALQSTDTNMDAPHTQWTYLYISESYIRQTPLPAHVLIPHLKHVESIPDAGMVLECRCSRAEYVMMWYHVYPISCVCVDVFFLLNFYLNRV